MPRANLICNPTHLRGDRLLKVKYHFLGGLSLQLKPPYSIALDNLRLAIWDTSFWTFWLKFGHKGP